VSTKICDGSSQNFMFEMLFHVFGYLKEEGMGFLN
jgi:hypothetical protein